MNEIAGLTMTEHTGLRKLSLKVPNADASHFGPRRIELIHGGNMATTRGTKIVYNVRNERLRLGAEKLQQIDHPETGHPWFVTAADFRAAFRKANEFAIPITTVRVQEHGGRKPYALRVTFVLPNSGIKSYGMNDGSRRGFGQIGCSYFSPEVFQLLVRKFRARKTQARAAKAGA